MGKKAPPVYGSVYSGIEAVAQAWHSLGWQPVFFSEIEKFPSATLAHHYGSNMQDEPHSQNGTPKLRRQAGIWVMARTRTG